MLLHSRTVTCALAALLLLTCRAAIPAENLQVAGLAVYTDTARDIYIAGLLTPDGSLPADVTSISPPASMEYHIATRRISDRGLSGTILLQAEVGGGKRANDAVIDGLEQLKKRMKGALRNGDQFEVALTGDNKTQFNLNGVELLSLDSPEVFYFLLQGWVGDSASALMRDSLLSGSLDPSVRTRYESLIPLQDRVDAIAQWNSAPPVEEPAKPEPKVAAAPKPEPKPEPAAAAKPEAEVASAPAAESEPAAAAEAAGTAALASTTAPETAPAPIATPEPEPVVSEAAETVAMVTQPAAEDPDAWVDDLDDREYQRLLNDYIASVMVKVFKSVKYPKRAVKKNLEGQVEMLARVDSSGKLLSVDLEQSSGHNILDEAALEAIDRAAPFPALTPVAKAEFLADDGGDSYYMLIPVKFKLN